MSLLSALRDAVIPHSDAPPQLPSLPPASVSRDDGLHVRGADADTPVSPTTPAAPAMSTLTRDQLALLCSKVTRRMNAIDVKYKSARTAINALSIVLERVDIVIDRVAGRGLASFMSPPQHTHGGDIATTAADVMGLFRSSVAPAASKPGPNPPTERDVLAVTLLGRTLDEAALMGALLRGGATAQLKTDTAPRPASTSTSASPSSTSTPNVESLHSALTSALAQVARLQAEMSAAQRGHAAALAEQRAAYELERSSAVAAAVAVSVGDGGRSTGAGHSPDAEDAAALRREAAEARDRIAELTSQLASARAEADRAKATNAVLRVEAEAAHVAAAAAGRRAAAAESSGLSPSFSTLHSIDTRRQWSIGSGDAAPGSHVRPEAAAVAAAATEAAERRAAAAEQLAKAAAEEAAGLRAQLAAAQTELAVRGARARALLEEKDRTIAVQQHLRDHVASGQPHAHQHGIGLGGTLGGASLPIAWPDVVSSGQSDASISSRRSSAVNPAQLVSVLSSETMHDVYVNTCGYLNALLPPQRHLAATQTLNASHGQPVQAALTSSVDTLTRRLNEAAAREASLTKQLKGALEHGLNIEYMRNVRWDGLWGYTSVSLTRVEFKRRVPTDDACRLSSNSCV